MGDAHSSVERENEKTRLEKLNPISLSNFLKSNHCIVWEYADVVSDLRKLGYMVNDTRH